MVEDLDGGVRRAAEMVDGLSGDTQTLFEQMASQLEATIARNEELRDGLVAQVERLEQLLGYQRGQLSALRAAADGVPDGAGGGGRERAPAAAIDLSVDPGDPSIGYGDRVLRIVAERGDTTIDDVVERLVAAGDRDATRRRVSTAITNLRRAGRVERDGDRVRLTG